MSRILLFVLLPALAWAQGKNLFVDLQLHRDFHRELFTSTVEIFEQDRLGTVFFFADNDFGGAGAQGSYFEIARNQALLRRPFGIVNVTLQFNDGVLSGDGLDARGVSVKQIPRTVLGGLSLSDIRIGAAQLEVQALVRQEFAADIGWQLTGVWYYPLPHSRFELLGNVDWNSNATNHQPTSVQTEPQLQYRRGSWAIGSELEISRNFAGAYTANHGFSYGRWYTHPTLYLRVDF
jgi:hypothetical protein